MAKHKEHHGGKSSGFKGRGKSPIKRHHSGSKAPSHDGMMHADHHMFNQEHGLPKDVFGHDGQQYGGDGCPVQEDNEADLD